MGPDKIFPIFIPRTILKSGGEIKGSGENEVINVSGWVGGVSGLGGCVSRQVSG